MTSFLSDTNNKPRLIEPKLLKKIINDQNKILTFESKIKIGLIDFIKLYYKFIFGFVIVLICLYWRYSEIQKRRRNIKKENIYYSVNDDDY